MATGSPLLMLHVTFSRTRSVLLLNDSIWLLLVSPAMWMWLPCVDSDCIHHVY